MPTRTLLQLREEVRQTTDLESATSWLDDAEVTRYVNEAISEWWDLLLEAHGQEWYLEEYGFTTVSGTEEYTIDDSSAATFYVLKGVDIEISGERYPLAPYNLLQRNMNTNGQPQWYRLKGNVDKDTGVYTKKIRLQPKPDGAYPIYLLYVPSAPVLVDDADVWEGHNGWEEFIVVSAAIRVLIKDESDTTALEIRKAQLEQRIRNVAGSRDWSTSEMVTDTASIGPSQGGPLSGSGSSGPTVIFTGTGGGSAEASSILLWEWNQTDLTQFEATEAYNSGWTTSLSVVANTDLPGGNVIRYAHVSGSSPFTAVTLIKESELTFPLRYVVDLEVMGAGALNNHGWVFYGDDSSGNLYAYGFDPGAAWKIARYDGSSHSVHTNTVFRVVETASSRGARVVFTVDGAKAAGEEPKFLADAIGYIEEGDTDPVAISCRQIDVPNRPVPAAWNTVSPTRAGISISSWAGGSNNAAIDIASIRVYTHPRDR